MTSRERFLAVLSGEPVDRPFLWESALRDAAVDRWRNEGLPADADPYDALGLERIACVWVDYAPDPPFEEGVINAEGGACLVETDAGALIRRHPRSTSPGGREQAEEEVIRFPLRDRPSWHLIRDRLDPASPVRNQAFAAFLARNAPPPSPVSGLSGSFDPADGLATAFQVMMPTYWFVRTAGFMTASTLLYDDPDLVDEIFQTFTDFLATQLEPVLGERAPDIAFLNEDSAASRQGPIMSPEMYARYAVPALARLAGMFRDAGTPLVFAHCGGNVLPLVETWTRLGVNGLIPLDAPTDLAWLTREFPDLALIGGIHRGMLQGNPDALARHVFDRAALLYRNRRAVPSGDVYKPVTGAVSWRHMKTYVQALHEAGVRHRV